MNPAIKVAAETEDGLVLDINLVPYGGLLNGRDLDGEYFSASTDLCTQFNPAKQWPLLYHHGHDGEVGITVLGTFGEPVKKADGFWVQAQIDAHNEYIDAVKELVGKNALFASSGALNYLTEVKANGEITRWPLMEGSLTPTPANALARVTSATVEKHFKSAGLEFTTELPQPQLTPKAKRAPKSVYFEPVRREHAVAGSIPGTSVQAPAVTDSRVAEERDPAATVRTGDANSVAYIPGKSAKFYGDVEGSMEDFIDDIFEALNARNPWVMDSGFVSVQATIPDTMSPGAVIVRVCGYGDDDDQLYRIPYTVDDEGEPVLGQPEPVQVAFTPDPEANADDGDAMKAMPLVLHIASVHRSTDALAQRTKDLRERRAKEGRVLSTATRQRLQALVDAMKASTGDIEDLLTATEPTAKADEHLAGLLELRHRHYAHLVEAIA